MRTALAAVLAALVSLTACGAETPVSSSPKPAYTDTGPAELTGMLKETVFLLINTHVLHEGEIEQTDLFLPFDRAAELVDRLPADKAAKIVVYRRSDRMSRIAAEEWAHAGCTNLHSLDGGLAAWEDTGHSLSSIETATDGVPKRRPWLSGGAARVVAAQGHWSSSPANTTKGAQDAEERELQPA